jgi:redox-sensing transcriptional repressor
MVSCEYIHKIRTVLRPKSIPESTVRRMSLYLRSLQEAQEAGMASISSDELAERGGTTSAQVRKDLSFFGSFGKRGFGYPVRELIAAIRDILGLDHTWRVALVGAGRIGSALFGYQDFQRRGFQIQAVFDTDPAKVGQSWGRLTVRGDAEMEAVLRDEEIEIVIVAVPADAAQRVVDRVARAGVRAVLNFAPVRLRAPASVALRTVDMSTELESLAFALNNS